MSPIKTPTRPPGSTDAPAELASFDRDLVARYQATKKKKGWEPLGRVLLEQRTLSARQVMRLLEIQIEEPEHRLGDLAVREGYCTVDQVEEALRIQREGSFGPADLALRGEGSPEAELFGPVLGYASFLEARLFVLNGSSPTVGPPGGPRCPTHRFLVNVIARYLRSTDQPARIAEDFEQLGESGNYRPLGRILLDMRLLNVRQLMGLLAIQLEEPSKMVGDLAIREEYCTPEQIAEALHEQRSRVPSLAGFLAEHPYVTESTARDLMNRYVGFLEGRIREQSLSAV